MTTRCLLPLLSLAVLCVAACSTSGPEVGETATTSKPSRTFRFTYAARIPAPPRGTRELSVWVPLPHDDPDIQKVTNLKIQASGAWKVTTEPVYGNRMIYMTIANPGREESISWSALVTRYEDSGQGTLPSRPQYLQSNKLIPIDGEARTIAVRLDATDKERPVHWRARRIFDDVLDGMEYNKSVAGYGYGDFQRSITVCKGNCTDFHARFTGVARAAGIPVRFTMGIPMKPVAEGRYNNYHCWAHYHDGNRWQPVDISEADKVVSTDPERAHWFFGHLGQDRIGLTFGRDLVLSPAQKGESLNYFVFPHAEADGKPLTLDKSMWEFTYKNT